MSPAKISFQNHHAAISFLFDLWLGTRDYNALNILRRVCDEQDGRYRRYCRDERLSETEFNKNLSVHICDDNSVDRVLRVA